MRDNKILFYTEKYSPFIIFFSLMLFIHFFMGFFGDDIIHSQVLNKYSMLEYSFVQYNHGSSRFIIDVIGAFFSSINMYFWALFDSFLFTVGAFYVIKVINKKENKNIIILGILLFLIYPFAQMSSAGWVATTMTYLWPFALGMVSFIPLINERNGEETTPLVYLISIVSLLYAANKDQNCVILVGVHVLYLISSILNKRGISMYNIIALIISVISFVLILKCPGSANRVAMEISTWYPAYANFGILQKIYLGTVPTFGILIKDKFLLAIFYSLLSICAAAKIDNKHLKYFFYFNVLFILLLTVFSPFLTNLFPHIQKIFDVFAYQGIPNLSNYAIMAIIICIYLLVNSCIMLYVICDKNIFPGLLFLLGFASRFVMGFSPTIFASSERTMFTFYMVIILLSLMVINKLYEFDVINEHSEFVINAIFIVLAVYNYIDLFVYLS